MPKLPEENVNTEDKASSPSSKNSATPLCSRNRANCGHVDVGFRARSGSPVSVHRLVRLALTKVGSWFSVWAFGRNKRSRALQGSAGLLGLTLLRTGLQDMKGATPYTPIETL